MNWLVIVLYKSINRGLNGWFRHGRRLRVVCESFVGPRRSTAANEAQKPTNIRKRKQRSMDQDNARENAKRIRHTFSVGDSVLRNKSKARLSTLRVPYVITEVYDNGTVEMRKGVVTETLSIRLLEPYYE